MMKSAQADLSHSPVRAGVRAQIAVAIAILSVAPVRLENLTHIRLGFNLIKPDGPESNYWLVFPDYDVKNRVKLEYPLPTYLTRLIDEYVFDFRPALLRGSNEDWLFPGQRGGAKGKISFSGQISDRIYKATGLRMTVHQFRHAAGALILKKRPGEYQLVRLLLGHRDVQTTINAYIGLENIHASEIYRHRHGAARQKPGGSGVMRNSGEQSHPPRSLPVHEWPATDQRAHEEACRPGTRFKPGGSASYLAEVSRRDFWGWYGAFLGFLHRTGRLDESAAAAAQVTPQNVEAYLTDLNSRVRSVTVWNCIYKLRRAAELLTLTADFSWLAEIEKDVALIMVPRSKFDRLVLCHHLLGAGLTLISEGIGSSKSDIARAVLVRNGLMIALLALHPIRLKNYVALEIGTTFKEVQGSWWIILPSSHTKSRRPDERRVPKRVNWAIEAYLNQWRPVLIGSEPASNRLWISSTTGRPLTYKNLGTLISKITRETLGIDVSPHLFRTAAASTAAIYGGDTPGLGSAILNHTHRQVTDKDYNRASSMQASGVYAEITKAFIKVDP
jgi:integrase